MIAAAAGVAISAAIGAGLLKAMDVTKANGKLAAQLGLNKKQSEKAGKAAGALYAANYGESIEEVNTAVGAVMSSIKGMRNASSADVEAMTEKMLILSDTMGLDVARASQVAGQMITSGLAKDGGHAADLLMASLQKVPAAVREDILDATDEYGPFFSNLGISGEKAMGMLVKASESGMYGIDKTGDALKEFGIRATDMSKATGGAYEAIGLDQQEMTNSLLAGGDKGAAAFQKIVAGLQGMEDPAMRSQAALALFGTPLEDLSVTEIPKFLGSLSSTETALGDVSGSVDKAGAALYENARDGFGAFKRQAETALINVVTVGIMPALTSFAGFLSGTLGPALTGLSTWIAADGLPALRTFGNWFVANQGPITTIATLIGVVLIPVFIRLAAQALISAATQVTAWAMSSGGAVKTAAVYVASSYTMIGRWVAMGAAAVVSVAKTVTAWTLSGASAVKGAIVYGVQSARVAAAWVVMSAAAVASGAKTAAVWTGTVIKQAVLGAAAFAVQTGRIVAGWVLMGAQSLLQAARMAAAWLIAMGPVGWVIAAVIALVALVIANWDKVSAWTKKAWTAVVGFIVTAWQNIKNWTVEFLASIGRWISDKFNSYLSLTKAVWAFIFNTIRDKWSAIKSTVLNALIAVARYVLQKFTDAKNTATSIWGAILGMIRQKWSDIKNSVLSALVQIGRWISEKFTNAKATATKIWNDVLNVLKNIWTGIKDTFNKGVDGVASKWGELREAAKKPVRFVVNKVINEGLIDTFNRIPGVNIPHVKLPKGFRKGGYTGNGREDEEAGVVHGREFVMNAPATAAIGKDNLAAMAHNAVRGPQAAVGAGVYGGIQSFRGPHFQAIDDANAVRVIGDGPSKSRWYLNQAAQMWNGLANVRLLTNATTGASSLPRIDTNERPDIYGVMRHMPNWAGYYMNGGISLNPAAAYMSPVTRRTVAAHEVGHALGLPHAMATGAHSIMNYNNMYKHNSVTSQDASALRAIYGAPGSGNKVSPSSPLPNDPVEPVNPFDGLIDGLMKKIKDKFPDSGMFVDAAGGLAKTGMGQVVKWVTDIKDGIKNIAGDVVDGIKNFFGVGAMVPNGGEGISPTLMDGGGWLRESDGATVIHQKKKPDAFTPYDEWQQMKADYAASRGGNGDTWNVQLPQKASVNDLMDAVSFQQRRNARGGARR